MKIITKCCITIIICLLSIQSYSQHLIIKGGFNLSELNVKNDLENFSSYYDMNLGFNLATMAEFSFSKLLSLETGITLETKGFRYEKEGLPSDQEYKIKSNLFYAGIPVLLKPSFSLNDRIKLYGEFGPYIGLGVYGNMKYYLKDQNEEENYTIDVKWGNTENEDLFNRLDYGLIFGAGMEINKILVGINYDLGLANISPESSNGTIINNRVLKLYIGYKLGKK